MQEFLKSIKNASYDVYTFLPGEDEDQICIEVNDFGEKGDKVGGSHFGDYYTIILFKEDVEEDKIVELDRFDAILTSPVDYMTGLIDNDWFGIICKKTTTSSEFCDKAFDCIKEAC